MTDAAGKPIRPKGLPFWYDTPVWLASGMVNSIGIACLFPFSRRDDVVGWKGE